MTDCMTDIEAGVACTLDVCDNHPGHPGQGHSAADLAAAAGGVSDPEKAYRFVDQMPKCCSRDTRDWKYGDCEDCP